MKKYKNNTDMDTKLQAVKAFSDEYKKHKGETAFIMNCPFCGQEESFEVINFFSDTNGECTSCSRRIHIRRDSSTTN